MALEKNTAGKWTVFAFDVTTNLPVTGDAANITADVYLDGSASANAVDDTNPLELGSGYYVFDITAVENNADMVLIDPDSTTGDVQVIGVPGVQYPVAPNTNAQAITATGATAIDWANVENPTTALDLSATDFQTVDTATVAGNMRGTDNAATETKQDVIDANVVLILADTGTDGVLLAATATSAQLVDDVWDEPLTGATHNDATSSGKRLRQVEEAFVHAAGTIAVVSDGHTITLDAGAVATADFYIGDRLQIVEGTGAGQSRIIVAYTSGKVVTLDSDFTTNPNAASLYEVVAADVHVSVSDSDLATGFVAVATSTTTITLDSMAVATADYYTGETIVFTHGTGSGQARQITGYTAGRVVTMSPALATAVDTATTYHVQTAVSIAEIVDEVWDEAQADHTTAGTFGEMATEIAAIPTTAMRGTDNAPTKTQMDTAHALLATPSQVNAQVVDVIRTDTTGEPAQGTPPATASLSEKIDWIFKTFRNKKTQTSTTWSLFNDAGTVVDSKATVSDVAGTATKTEVVTGP